MRYTVFGLPWPPPRERQSLLPPTQAYTQSPCSFDSYGLLPPFLHGESFNCYDCKITTFYTHAAPFISTRFMLFLSVSSCWTLWHRHVPPKPETPKSIKPYNIDQETKCWLILSLYSHCSLDCVCSCVSRVKVGQRAYQKVPAGTTTLGYWLLPRQRSVPINITW